MAKNSDPPVSSVGPRTKGSRKPPDENLFGTDAEVGDRNPNKSLMDQYGLPEGSPTSFSQIAPKSGGGSVNRAPLTRKSGDFKVSSGIGKP